MLKLTPFIRHGRLPWTCEYTQIYVREAIAPRHFKSRAGYVSPALAPRRHAINEVVRRDSASNAHIYRIRA
jgi:hypothetical protein